MGVSSFSLPALHAVCGAHSYIFTALFWNNRALDSGFTHFSQHPRPGPLAPLNAPSGFASELFGGVARAGAHLENL